MNLKIQFLVNIKKLEVQIKLILVFKWPYGRTMAKAVSRRHFTAKVQLWLWSSSSRVVMDKVALDQISRQVPRLYSIISPMLHTHIHLSNILIRRRSGGIFGICIQSHEVRTPKGVLNRQVTSHFI